MRITNKNQDLLKIFLTNNTETNTFKSLAVVPPESPLEQALEVFETETNIPLQLPLVSFLTLVSTYLMKKEATINVKGTIIRPDIWTIALANSGAGKTKSHTKIAKSAKQLLGVGADFPAIAGAGAFIEELQKHNNSLWFYDEIAQFIGGMEILGSPTNQCKEYLLKTYDGDKIERITKKDSTIIENPQLAVLGMNTIDSFINKISDESFTDGFCQRFAFVIAKPDESRPIDNFEWFNDDMLTHELNEAFEKIATVKIHQEYSITAEAFQTYRRAFRQLLKLQVSESFYRRLMFRSWKYAMIYHVILDKDSNTIDEEDIAWAMRMIRLHLNDLKEILKLYNYSKIEKIVQRVEDLKKKQGDKLTVRHIVQYEKNIKSVAEAKQVWALVNELADLKKNPSTAL